MTVVVILILIIVMMILIYVSNQPSQSPLIHHPSTPPLYSFIHYSTSISPHDVFHRGHVQVVFDVCEGVLGDISHSQIGVSV